MSEKLYALLLRLYPARFREAYGEEALQLFRDRARHERGFPLGLRLWLDLLRDWVVSIPRAYFHAPLIPVSGLARADGVPSFTSLQGGELPRPGALAAGGVLTGVAVFIVAVLLGRGGSKGPLAQEGGQAQSQQASSLNAGTASENGGTSSPGEAATGAASSEGAKGRERQGNAIVLVDQELKLDAAQRHRVIQAAAANIGKYYIDADLAQKTAERLLAREKKWRLRSHYGWAEVR
jgi:hypothetical protein